MNCPPFLLSSLPTPGCLPSVAEGVLGGSETVLMGSLGREGPGALTVGIISKHHAAWPLLLSRSRGGKIDPVHILQAGGPGCRPQTLTVWVRAAPASQRARLPSASLPRLQEGIPESPQ